MQKHDALLRSRGGNPDFGESNHIVAHKAGFDWDKIEMSSWGWEYSGKDGRQVWTAGAKDSFRAAALKAGIATEAEMDENKRAWEAWGENPEARFVAIDGAILCWK